MIRRPAFVAGLLIYKLRAVMAELMERFDYGLIEQRDIDKAEATVARIKGNQFQALRGICEDGDGLREVRDILPKPKWGEWLDYHFGMSQVTARRYMRVSAVLGSTIARTEALLDITQEAAYVICRKDVSKEVRDDILDRAIDGERITANTVANLIPKKPRKDKDEQEKKRTVRCVGCNEQFDEDDPRIVDSITCQKCREEEAAQEKGINPNGPPVPPMYIPELIGNRATHEVVSSIHDVSGNDNHGTATATLWATEDPPSQSDDEEFNREQLPNDGGFAKPSVQGVGPADPRAHVRQFWKLVNDMLSKLNDIEQEAVLSSWNDVYPIGLVDAWNASSTDEREQLRKIAGGEFELASPVDAVRTAWEQATTKERKSIQTRVAGWKVLLSQDDPYDVDGRFDEFWEVVHKKAGKPKAKHAFAKAVDSKAIDADMTRDQSALFIISAMEVFSQSPAANPVDHSPIHPLTWLNQGRYDDDRKRGKRGGLISDDH